MAVDFDALDLVRTRNKAKRYEAIKQQQREQKEKNIKYFMNQLSEIKIDHDLCNDPAVKNLLLDKWLGVVKLCVKKIEEK
jgi:hypothetical protein